MELSAKYDRLGEILREMGSVVVAYSGGVDSTFLLKAACDALGRGQIGVMGISQISSDEKITEACRMAEDMGATFLTVHSGQFNKEEFISNPPERCYHCKIELFTQIRQIARKHGTGCVLDGNNADDAGEYRPGMAAGRLFKVRSPLLEAGLTKEDIRKKSRELGLPTWNTPSSPCLATRFPFGTRITLDGLEKIRKAEKFLNSLGLSQVRARYHEETLRIEVDKNHMGRLLEHSDQVVSFMKNLGFTFVTLDLAGYRTGSGFNEMLSQNEQLNNRN